MIRYPKCLFDKYGIEKIKKRLGELHYQDDKIIVDDQVGNVVIWSLKTLKPVTK
jgi:hypothetical protein